MIKNLCQHYNLYVKGVSSFLPETVEILNDDFFQWCDLNKKLDCQNCSDCNENDPDAHEGKTTKNLGYGRYETT